MQRVRQERSKCDIQQHRTQSLSYIKSSNFFNAFVVFTALLLCQVIIWDLDEQAMEETKTLLLAMRNPPPRIYTFRVDVSDRESVYRNAARVHTVVLMEEVVILWFHTVGVLYVFAGGMQECMDSVRVLPCVWQVAEEVGFVYGLVNNAGVVSGRPFLEIPDASIERTIKINTLGPSRRPLLENGEPQYSDSMTKHCIMHAS